MDDTDAIQEQAAPGWAVFGDLMSGLLGAFVLMLVCVLGAQMELAGQLEAEIQKRQAEEQRRQTLEQALAAPLAAYLGASGEMLMVSGFTDNTPLRPSHAAFADNWELSAQRALTVTRALIDAGMPSSSLFAAAFGPEQPVASNADAAGRSKNRRVEMAPVPKASNANTSTNTSTSNNTAAKPRA